MPDIDKAPEAPRATDEQLQRYHDAFDELTVSARKLEMARGRLTLVYNTLLIECDVPAGQGIDVHGDGGIKKKAECANPLEVN